MQEAGVNVAVLVSGGVDSSVALALLKQRGYNVTAFYLKIWLEDELAYLGDCPWQEDISYVEQICKQFDVPLEIVSFQREYWQEVVSYVLQEARAGRTPNPDIMCNKRVKFGAFLNRFGADFDYIASGHYAQTIHKDGQVFLVCSPDAIKDQTYFLSHVPTDTLKRLLFPIGHFTKEEVRSQAQMLQLATKDRKDSQGICFLGTIKFRDFIKHHLGEKQGPFIEVETGARVGTHQGFWFYTIGQRQGLGLAGGPWYVADKNSATNTVYISKNYHSIEKSRNQFLIGSVNWITGNPLETVHAKELEVKLRHGAYRHACTIEKTQKEGVFLITLATRDQGIAPGQFAVLYENDVCLGGGIIENEC